MPASNPHPAAALPQSNHRHPRFASRLGSQVVIHRHEQELFKLAPVKQSLLEYMKERELHVTQLRESKVLAHPWPQRVGGSPFSYHGSFPVRLCWARVLAACLRQCGVGKALCVSLAADGLALGSA